MISFNLKADEIKSDSDFPDDENGRVLLQMKERGDDLSKPRKIDFVVIFLNHSSAELFASHFKKLGYEVIINNSKTIDTHPWDVIIQKNMIPTHRDITVFEDELGEYAATMSGRTDGWGGFVQQK
ncbi:ribonuclease E inhibitor RraB [Methylophilus sp. TWE2]|uniref:ribonuclease E inhibitor RraB n=1 Tax=Methylophilus sp. TWE2 TaxID=1662285 RepID=UPI0006712F4F|nr:ribonuclease E inhibitor RraB [Methylophilus sp. TWE2]AKR43184.1 hypothetical protein ACJ67_06905 [Methylophilus sp. TWE2]